MNPPPGPRTAKVLLVVASSAWGLALLATAVLILGGPMFYVRDRDLFVETHLIVGACLLAGSLVLSAGSFLVSGVFSLESNWARQFSLPCAMSGALAGLLGALAVYAL